MTLETFVITLLAGLVALIVSAGWWSGSHCPRCARRVAAARRHRGQVLHVS